ncbi:hypothetical protein KG112_07195 [Nocardioides sp. zg-ZUI104]|uniref:AAA family ATPase n=1 Tax=Nocardioides faecalis TaxID=2803858 RepID=UPI001BD1B7CE|nr:AAA family ATPase [Nocardioides faecalis]MBS4752593.1 hypothetical protein [Nocardioides faecalis]
MIVVVLVSTGAAWEPGALAALAKHPGTVLLKRCVDLADLLATASTGQPEVAVLGTDLPGLDRAVVDELAAHGVRLVGVAADPDHTQPRAARVGIATVLPADRIGEVAEVLTTLPSDLTDPGRGAGPGAGPASEPGAVLWGPPDPDVPVRGPIVPAGGPGRVIAVWGPTGGPGRTTLAAALAGELARRGLDTLLVDADPYGGAVAQQLGILDEVSGLLAAARLSSSGQLAERFGGVQRRLSDRLRVLTGLPRADRWAEVRPGALTEIVETAREQGQVVLDTGFSLEHDPAADLGRPGRNDLTREAVEVADELVVVGAADPVGLARLVRGLREVAEVRPHVPTRVVVNRMRTTLGWREADVRAMLAGFSRSAEHGADPVPVHFLPEDQAALDRALVAGRLLTEAGDSALRRGVVELVAAMAGTGHGMSQDMSLGVSRGMRRGRVPGSG